MGLWRVLFGLLATTGLSWDDLNPRSSAANHGHPWGDIGMDMPSLVQLAEALGGGIYPGMGSGQSDTVSAVDSVAPSFPLNMNWVVPANQVKQQLVRLSFQPQAFRTYVSTALHSHTGDTHSVHVHSVATTLSHGNTGIEAQGHVHGVAIKDRGGAASGATVLANTGANNDLEANLAIGGGTFSPPTGADTAIGANDHGHAGSALHTTGYVDQTSVSNSNTGNTGTPTGVQEGTSPDAMHVIVDGTDVTTQLGGPFTGAQTELEIGPYVAAGSGLHSVQITSTTNLGRIAGFVRHKRIENNLGTSA